MQNTHPKFFQLNFILLLFSTLLTLIACGPSFNEEEPQPNLTDGSSLLQGYPSVGYPVGTGLDAYPVPPSTDSILNQPPAELPTFPGKIAFQTERFGGKLQVAILDGATGQIAQLNQSFDQSFEPEWSPECSEIIFTVGQADGLDFELYRQDVNDLEATEFVNHSNYYDWGASWSHAKDVIAYQTNENALINVCFADQDGNELGCMQRSGFSNGMPAWSPDGTQLVFSSNRDGNWELYLTDYPAMNVMERLTENSARDYDPVFSPDGRTIIFSSKRGADYNLYAIQVDGQNEQQLTRDGTDERFPAWVGNELIAYSAGFQQEMELYLMNIDGSNPQRLTYSAGRDEWPSWCAIP